jgi:hypothetical protein
MVFIHKPFIHEITTSQNTHDCKSCTARMETGAQFCVITVYCCHLVVMFVIVIHILAQRFIHAADMAVHKRKTQV